VTSLYAVHKYLRYLSYDKLVVSGIAEGVCSHSSWFCLGPTERYNSTIFNFNYSPKPSQKTVHCAWFLFWLWAYSIVNTIRTLCNNLYRLWHWQWRLKSGVRSQIKLYYATQCHMQYVHRYREATTLIFTGLLSWLWLPFTVFTVSVWPSSLAAAYMNAVQSFLKVLEKWQKLLY